MRAGTSFSENHGAYGAGEVIQARGKVCSVVVAGNRSNKQRGAGTRCAGRRNRTRGMGGIRAFVGM